jgi:hypothetical protein
MPKTPKTAPFALALLAATCLTPVGAAQAAPGDALGAPFQVNTTGGLPRIPSVAMDADGDFVMAWFRSFDPSHSSPYYDIVARRYDAAGIVQGDEFQVNTTPGGLQWLPAVAMDLDGDFVVAWDGPGILAQRYNERGGSEGPEFRVDAKTIAGHFPSIAMDADGDFVVVWERWDGEYPASDIFAQRYNAAGEPQGGEFRVNATTIGSQDWPAVAMDDEGNFVVAWESRGQDGDSSGVFAQSFDAAGVAQGPEFQVNTTTIGRQERPSVAMDADGDFVVAWSGNEQPDPCNASGSKFDVFARRYDSVGNPLSGEIQVSSITKNNLGSPTVAMDADGDFVVAWYDYCKASTIVRRYDAAGSPEDGEVQLEAAHIGVPADPTVAMDADGDYVVAWHDAGGGGYRIFAQRFQGPGLRAGDFDTDGKADILWHNAASGAAVLWRMNGFTKVAAEPVGAAAAPWSVAGIADFTGETKADILWRNAETGNTVLWQMDGSAKVAAGALGTVPPAWQIEGLGDLDGDAYADILWRNAATGNAIVWLMDGFTRKAAQSIGFIAADWTVAGTGDFDGDAKADILWRNAATGNTVVWLMDGLQKVAAQSIGAPDTAWKIRSPAPATSTATARRTFSGATAPPATPSSGR